MARDKFHPNVLAALISDGWTITHDPLRLQSGKIDIEIDIGAEKIIGAAKEGVIIAVEVKNFLNRSPVADFEDAYGQFLLYRRILQKKEADRHLFLAVPEFAYNTFFQRPLIQEILEDDKIDLIVFDHLQNNIILWKNW